MLTEEQILQNKDLFINLLKDIKRPDAEVESLINKLLRSDFFEAPASTIYHSSFKGGLCYHSLNVYKRLKELIKMHYEEGTCPYNEETLIITSLLHDISKMNYYTTEMRNVKNEEGKWVQIPYIKKREAKDRFIYSSHGVNSEFMVHSFIPLTVEESVAIISHMGNLENTPDVFGNEISEIFNKYPLALLLHLADMDATFFDERIIV